MGNLFTEQNRDQHHHYKSTLSSLFSRRNIAKMEDMIQSKCDMLRGHLWAKVDAGETVDILAAVRSLATDVISTYPRHLIAFKCRLICVLAELTYGNSLNFLEAGIEKNDILDAMDSATSNWFQLAYHFPSLISIMSKIPASVLKRLKFGRYYN